MGEWLNNLRSQLTEPQNDHEAGAVVGKKTLFALISHQPQTHKKP